MNDIELPPLPSSWSSWGALQMQSYARAAVIADRERRQPAPSAEPVGWRVRGYSAFKTGAPRDWRYVDGPTAPRVNNPECCDIEPLYAAPQPAPALPPDAVAAMRLALDALEYYHSAEDYSPTPAGVASTALRAVLDGEPKR
jgi:hypothetical protein